MSKIGPALTPEEWADTAFRKPGPGGYLCIASGSFVVFECYDPPMLEGQKRHALAALCLYQQPFGFTHEDIALLRKLNEANDYAQGDRFGVLDVEITPDETARLQSLASRIASLLPPKNSAPGAE
jgi:hypothetical protein